MRIPKSFKLFGHTMRVRLETEMNNDEQLTGQIRHSENLIRLQADIKGCRMARSRLEHVFLHEVVHACLHVLGEFELRNNERLVEQLSNCLHQFLTTQRGDLL